MYYVYILKLENGQFYIGYTADLQERVKEHKRGRVDTTKRLRPNEIIFYAAFKHKKKALGFERYLKTYSGFAFRNKRLI
ncbi:MAG: GIY-YIG nuclease family protein [Candidatus Berkelbacteria bacterium]|nr:GIY-YIG nuclease family protein [Candidatus Berkelbacteria bacterium]